MSKERPKPKKGSRYIPKSKARPLTLKEKELVRLLTETKTTPTKAVMTVYDIKKPNQASSFWGSKKKLPKIQNALLAHSSLAEDTIIKAILDYKDSEKQWQRSLAVDTSKWVHDKIYGKAVQQNSNVNLNFTAHADEKRKEYDL
jgi:hypothetical protein